MYVLFSETIMQNRRYDDSMAHPASLRAVPAGKRTLRTESFGRGQESLSAPRLDRTLKNAHFDPGC